MSALCLGASYGRELLYIRWENNIPEHSWKSWDVSSIVCANSYEYKRQAFVT